MADKTEDIISGEVEEIFSLQRSLEATQAELMANDTFLRFIELQKTFNERSEEVWANVERQMIDNDIKSIKGEWGSLTITERLQWEYDPSQLSPKYFKKVVDTKKLSDTYRLEGKAPNAATPKFIKFLTKRIKGAK